MERSVIETAGGLGSSAFHATVAASQLKTGRGLSRSDYHSPGAPAHMTQTGAAFVKLLPTISLRRSTTQNAWGHRCPDIHTCSAPGVIQTGGGHRSCVIHVRSAAALLQTRRAKADMPSTLGMLGAARGGVR